MMHLKHSLIPLTALALVACGGDEQALKEPTQPGSVTYSYPTDGQEDVSPIADVVLRFSHAITTKDSDLANLIQVSADGESAVDFGITRVDDGHSLVLSTGGQLATGADYTVTFREPLQAEGGRAVPVPNAFGDNGIQFTTRAAAGTGVQSLASLSDTFEVVGTKPSTDGLLKPMDFSTFRLRTSQPIHPDSVTYGQTVSLRDAEGNLVPADVLANGRRLTVDPCTTEQAADCGSPADELNAGEQYTLTVSGLLNQKGESIQTFEQSFRPIETGPTEILFQETVDSDFEQRSILNGQFVNAVRLNSVLQGTAGPSQQTGALYAELAYGPNFPGDNPIPLRIPRNTLLSSTSLDVKIGGVVPLLDEDKGVIEQTGQIGVTMVSDASGYLYPNPYSDSVEAPRHVRLFMDVAMNTEEDQPNSALSQDLLRVQLTGIAKVRDDILQIDAIGIVEPNLLGQEVTDSTIAFQIKADTGAQDTAPPRPKDTSGPTLVSWMPGEEASRQASQRPGDPIILNLNEPLDRDTLGGITLMHSTDGEVNARVRHDGTTLAINAPGGLKHEGEYTLTVPGTVTDLAGNAYAGPQSFMVNLPSLADQSASSPLAVTTYPGFPCTTDDKDIPNDIHGRCTNLDENTTPDDLMPVHPMPTDRPITVVFSQSMDAGSITPDTFTVEKVLSFNGGVAATTEPVPGRLEKNTQRVRFYPDEGWEPGTYYRYTMASESSTSPDCTSAICSTAGQALETNALEGLSKRGGPDMTIYFKGSEANQAVFSRFDDPKKTVFNPLRNVPVQDVNADQTVDCPDDGSAYQNGDAACVEPFTHPANDNGGFSAPQSTRIIESPSNSGNEARVGCNVDNPPATCPELQYIFQTGGLNTEIIGPVDPDDPSAGVEVRLYPTLLTTSSVTVYANAPLLGFQETPTGKQVIRMRYRDEDGDGTRDHFIRGVIKPDDKGEPIFASDVDLYFDAPDLNPEALGIGLDHNVHSVDLPLNLSGRVKFLTDGRTLIEQKNSNEPEITISAGGGLVTFTIQVPEQGAFLQFLSNPIKDLIAPPEGS